MSVPLPPELEEAKRLLYRALGVAQGIDADAAALLQMFRTMRQRRWERDGADGAPI